MENQKLIDEYHGKLLAVESFGGNKKLYVENFTEKENMLNELYRLDCHEITLTDEGIKFLDEYYTLDSISDMLLNEIKNGVDYKYTKKEDIINWLKSKGNL